MPYKGALTHVHGAAAPSIVSCTLVLVPRHCVHVRTRWNPATNTGSEWRAVDFQQQGLTARTRTWTNRALADMRAASSRSALGSTTPRGPATRWRGPLLS